MEKNKLEEILKGKKKKKKQEDEEEYDPLSVPPELDALLKSKKKKQEEEEEYDPLSVPPELDALLREGAGKAPQPQTVPKPGKPYMRQLNAIGALEQFRDQGRDRPGPGGYEALAKTLSGVTAGAGTYGGVIPDNSALESGINALRKKRLDREQQLLSNIELAGIEDAERNEQRSKITPINEATRDLIKQKLKDIGVPEDKMVEPGPDWTYGDIANDPLLGPVFRQSLGQDGAAENVDYSGLVEMRRYEDEQRAKQQQISDNDREILKQKFKEFGIENFEIPEDYTLGDLEDLKNRPIIGEALTKSFDREKERIRRRREREKARRKQREREREAARRRRERERERLEDERERLEEQRDEQRKWSWRRKQEAKSDKRYVDKQTRALSRDISSLGMPQAWSNMRRVVELIPPEGEDIPGFGNEWGENLWPTVVLDKKAKELRQRIKKLQNTTLSERSGAAVSVQEFNRLASELGTSNFASEEEMRLGVATLLEELQAITRNLYAGYPEEAIERYENDQRMGEPFRDYLNLELKTKEPETKDHPPLIFFKEDDGSITKQELNSREEYEKALEEGGTLDIDSLRD